LSFLFLNMSANLLMVCWAPYLLMIIHYLGLWSAQGPVGRTMAFFVSGRRTWLAGLLDGAIMESLPPWRSNSRVGLLLWLRANRARALKFGRPLLQRPRSGLLSVFHVS
jgi:hypothetical protein